MNDEAAHRPVDQDSNPDHQSDLEAEEIPVKVHDYARACRSELERLSVLQNDATAGYQKVREAVARLESLAPKLHPLLAEKIRRVAAIARRMGQAPLHAPDVSANDDRRRDFIGTLYARLDEVQNSPLWALPQGAAAREEQARRREQESGMVLKPGAIYPDRVVLYMLGDLRFMVRGTLQYNLHRADLSRHYAIREGGPRLEIFPNPDRDSRAFPAPAHGGNLMVFLAPGRGEGESLGLRYDRILGIEDYSPARHDRGIDALTNEHPIVTGRLSRSGRDFYVIGL